MPRRDTKNKQRSIEKPLVNKILFLDVTSEYLAYFTNMYSTLKKFCKEIICFNRRDYYFRYGKDEMNKRLLDVIKKEKPDYVFTWITWDEFYADTLLKIREISPNTKTVAIFGDDSAHFDNSSRYNALLFDFCFTTLNSYIKKYKDDGINNIFSTNLVSTEAFKPLNLKKKYDVTFIGTQKQDQSGRYELIKFLKDKGVNIRIYGFGWENYPELKSIYHGALKDEEMLNVINESKINLCFSRDNFGKPQQKARVFEVAACRAFTLAEFAPQYLDYFRENRELPMFKTKEEMLEKIEYFLKHDRERDRIADRIYKRTAKDYGLYNELRSFFLKTRDKVTHRELPALTKKTLALTEEQLNLHHAELKELLRNIDYVSFKPNNSEPLKYKDYFQTYSLEKTGKNISCCDYYAYTPALGDYVMLSSKYLVGLFDKKVCSPILELSQLMVTKDYFLKNLNKFKESSRERNIDFITLENTAFVSMPLVRIKNFNLSLKDYKLTKDAFSFKFIFKLYSLFNQKKLASLYPFALVVEALSGRAFILKSLKDNLLNKSHWTKLKKSL